MQLCEASRLVMNTDDKPKDSTQTMADLTVGCFIAEALFITGLICILTYHLRRLKLYIKASKFRGPPTIPIVGNAHHFIGNNGEIVQKLIDLSDSYPSPYRIWLGPELLIMVSHPEDVKKIVGSDKTIEKSPLYRFFRPWLGNGLFTAPTAIWRIHRKLIGPTFNLKILESFVSVFAAQSSIMVKKMETELNGGEFVIFKYVSLCAMDIICETAMGVSMGAQSNNSGDYIETVEKTFAIIYQRVFKAWLQYDAIFYRTRLGREQKKCLNVLHDFTNNVIRRKKEALLRKRDNRDATTDHKYDEDDSLPPRRKAYLDLLMELTDNQMKFTDQELREEVDTMIVAGHDTTSNMICSVLLMLASHPDVQEKAYRELEEIYGSSKVEERCVTHEDLSRMGYLERVIKETMRVFPIAATVSRAVTEDFDVGEYTLPKGSIVGIDIIKMHRSEEFWPDPFVFDPDRFLPQEIAKRHSCVYLPFSAGPRNCIGSRFAMMEMKTVLATILRRYIIKKDKITPIADIKLKSDVILKAADPIKLRIKERT
ncbi:cytochrome P450 4C1-like isoform X1 [Neodiprion pinetum]|uniref:cytochrome P450 4C1-like isoform X1 n=2 Tax=Neodiprion pinetum TaxID=441929 RepID=UPI00371E2D84